MAEKIISTNGNLSSSPNSTQAMDWNYYNWCKDYPVATLSFVAVSVISILLGFPASLWVLHELFQRQRHKSNVFMLSLAFIDLIFTIQIPFSLLNFTRWQIKRLEFVFDVIFSLSLNGRPLFMACICWDCYVAVIHPVVYKTSRKFAAIKKAITIIIYFFITGCGVVESALYWLHTTPFVAIPLFVSLLVITFCDISILRALRKPDPTGKISIHPQKKQALYTIFSSFLMTLVVYLPPMVIFSFGNLMPLSKEFFFCCLTCCGYCFVTAGCVIMPILYLVSVGKLDTFKNWWKKLNSICSR